MKDSIRARVASIIGAAFRGEKVSSVYDYTSGSYRTTWAEVTDGKVSGYDYGTSTHYSGCAQGGNLDFYDYEVSAVVKLRLDGSEFAGYDYHSGNHFSGTITGKAISLHDYETGQYYNFSL